jgi:diaminohydroxyphosphoribosylaminopyrimidine deaminase/5-amino-6-(5-phosphoribosylamino)uracil reductase
MSLDGKIATATGSSKWISGEASRSVVQQLRGRVDAIVVGRRTAQTDDPLLIARPAGPRQAARVVVDSHASLSPESRLAQSTADAPVLVATGLDAPVDRIARLTDVGCEVFACAGDTPNERLLELLDELGRRRMTNVLVEGGGELLGSLLDLGQIDEVHAFIAPKLVGGADSPGPLAGKGLEPIAAARRIASPLVEILGEDVYLHGRLEP